MFVSVFFTISNSKSICFSQGIRRNKTANAEDGEPAACSQEFEFVPYSSSQENDIFLNLSFLSNESDDNNNNERDNDEINEMDVELRLNQSEDNIELDTVKTRNKYKWTTYKEYDQFDEATEFLESEGFVVYDDSDLKIGQKFYYRCKRKPKAVKPYCACRFVLFLPSDRNIYILQHNGLEHNHNELMAGKKKLISDEMVSFVNALFEKNVVQYTQIIKFIDEKRSKDCEFIDEPNPNARQIEYRLKLYRNTDVKPLFDVGDIMQWCENNSSIYLFI